MSSNTSPLHYDHLEDPFNADVDFKVNISQKMTVPHKISFTDSSSNINSWMPNNEPTLDMTVPSRILVAGQNKHIGTKATPREIDYDNSILSREPYQDDVRVSTPPRTLTLDKYPYLDFNDKPPKEVVNPISTLDPYSADLNLTQDSMQQVDIDAEISATQEISHLRREMAKMNRRIMDLEMENGNRLQREKILYGFGLAYFVFKAIVWLNRSSY